MLPEVQGTNRLAERHDEANRGRRRGKRSADESPDRFLALRNDGRQGDCGEGDVASAGRARRVPKETADEGHVAVGRLS